MALRTGGSEDPADSSADARMLCAEIAGGAQEQVAFRAGERLVSRMALHEQKPELQLSKKLTVETRGSLDALKVEPAVRRELRPEPLRSRCTRRV